MDKLDGGPAFPATRIEARQVFTEGPQTVGEVTYPGMSLRDYFAAHAPFDRNSFGMASNALLKAGRPEIANTIAGVCEVLANFAYQYADAMIAERAK